MVSSRPGSGIGRNFLKTKQQNLKESKNVRTYQGKNTLFYIPCWDLDVRIQKNGTEYISHTTWDTKCIKDSNIGFECIKLPEEGTMAKHHCTTLAVVSDAFLKHRLPKQRQKPQLLSQKHKLLHSEGISNGVQAVHRVGESRS